MNAYNNSYFVLSEMLWFSEENEDRYDTYKQFQNIGKWAEVH